MNKLYIKYKDQILFMVWFLVLAILLGIGMGGGQ